MVAPAIPEVIEQEIESAIESRNEALPTLRELGPPDLVHLIKQSVKSGGRQAQQSGVYHHVTGIDASSSASLAAYINTLTQTAQDKSNKVISGIYCCYNAFSRLDMRVEVKIPGGVESYCIDERGDKRVASDSLWLETFLCGVLRAYSYADDGSGDTIKKIIAVRRFDPITSTDVEHKFLDAAERLFFKGWQLGSDPEIQVPNLVSNHLTTGILNYVHTTGRYASGQNLFEKLRSRDPEISSLLARVLISGDEEVKAVCLLKEAIEELPMDYSLLDCQATFLQSKGNLEWASPLAQRAVIAAPSEFGTWSKLAEIYVGLEQWDLALLTLNSCPMFTYTDKDAPRMPEPARVILPVLSNTALDEIDESVQGYDTEMVHPNLRKLSAAGYKGTFLKAYSLLTDITSKIGWDQLLRIRSQVFVMEEEYRSEKSQPGTGRTTGRMTSQMTGRNSSTTALRVPSPETNGEKANGDSSGSVRDDIEEDHSPTTEQSDTRAANGIIDGGAASRDLAIEKPEHTVASTEVKSGSEDVSQAQIVRASQNPDLINNVIQPDPSHTNYTHFQHKRLCERWLDNLFMVLYEDLRIYTIWRTDMARAKASNEPSSSSPSTSSTIYSKSAEEWEILGELAERLHHFPEAIEAYQSCLRIRFSPKAMRAVVKMWEEDKKTENVLQGMIRLIAWQYRWYSEFSPELLRSIRKLIEEEGAVKVRSIVQATSLPQPVLDLTHRYVELCATFRSNGSDG
ncbi:hypothetical protein MMC11_005775 [Xylographa trunciseda]|nr:hypothetical protein [Xylographa trunciseda]